ncbi:hypothetical protein CORMATOL_01255 [Corynebacterium matruchotii ATCC 33806]|uniref:Uncharacterized protein n=2 Tax=Corynebacterium matruchotii TaxID=43768 RepID=E0DFF0_9CORY|nr:hypothetical protein CORMATOL_01255 [Corynebacterium matruchotii ATCC 33806]EFM49063.1 hypothetical protein HMPREF0299_6594 [Corynebacterium matruchotii ATCC 14266]
MGKIVDIAQRFDCTPIIVVVLSADGTRRKAERNNTTPIIV